MNPLHRTRVCRRIERRFFRVVLALFFSCVTSLNLPGQTVGAATGTVEGRILNPVTGDYLLNARVSVKGTEQVALTDATGTYRLSGLPAGHITLRVVHPALDEQEATVVVRAGQSVQKDFDLTSRSRYGAGDEPVKLASFTVASTREMDADILANNEQRYAPNIKNVIAADAFGDVSEGNVSEFIKRLPGVSVIYPTGGDAVTISVRGFDAESTTIAVDGAQMPSASFSATGGARGANTEQISMTDVARVEVIKSPIPSMSADFLGGSVNLISKSSFERSKPQLTVRGTVQFTNADNSLDKTPGPLGMSTRKLRPGYDISYVNPVTKNFGFNLGAMRSNQFGRVQGPITTWEFAPAQGGSETAPYYRSVRTTGDSRETIRESYSAGVDWRPFPALTMKFGYRRGSYDLIATAGNRLTFNTGNNPASYGPDFTQGRAGAGAATHAQAWTPKKGATDHFSFSAKTRWKDWQVDGAASLGKSDNFYHPMAEGFFFNATTRIVTPTVRLEGFNGTDLPRIVQVRNAQGQDIDWKNLANYQILTVASDEREGFDEIAQGNLNLRREFRLGTNPGALQVGTTLNRRTVEKERWQPTWTFVGADGIAQNADNTAAPFVDRVNLGLDQGFNTPKDIQWVDARALHQLYLTNPNYFVLQEPAAFISQATNSEWIRQTITAAYLQGELKLFKNRLSLLGGVRFEKTENNGLGLLIDRNAIFQRNAAGNILRNPNGTPIVITTNALEQARLQYKPRGAAASQSYDDYFPSANATYNLLPDLLLRFSYAKTIGRPNFINIIPNLDVDEDDQDSSRGVVRARNTKLKPWTADGYEMALEYYFKSGGVVSAAFFRKDVVDAFASRTVQLTPALLADLGLGPAYEGWDFISTFNVGESTRINGIELNWQQRLTFLPEWARGISAFGNLTKLDVDGPGFVNLPTKSANWGVSYSRGRVGGGLRWNYQGELEVPLTSIGPGGVIRTKSWLTLDMNCEFRFNRRFTLFFNARNLTNSLAGEDRLSPLTPSYSHQRLYAERGVKMSAGIKATF
jgi:iron complex outermembrane receptor protein